MEYYLAIKSYKLLIQTPACIALKSTMLSGKKQISKGHIPYDFIYTIILNKRIRDGGRLVNCLGLGMVGNVSSMGVTIKGQHEGVSW